MTSLTILMAEDDPDERFLMEQALPETRPCVGLRFAEDGQDLKEFLLKLGNLGSELKIRPHGFPEPLDLSSRKPFKTALHHQKGFQLLPIASSHAHRRGARI
jgi:hypothetical protein